MLTSFPLSYEENRSYLRSMHVQAVQVKVRCTICTVYGSWSKYYKFSNLKKILKLIWDEIIIFTGCTQCTVYMISRSYNEMFVYNIHHDVSEYAMYTMTSYWLYSTYTPDCWATWKKEGISSNFFNPHILAAWWCKPQSRYW